MLFFLTLNDNHEVGVFPFQERLEWDSRAVSYLSEPLPLAIIQVVLERLTKKNTLNFKMSPQAIQSRISKIIEDFSWDMDLTWRKIPEAISLPEERLVLSAEEIGNEAWKAFNQLVRGRQLSIGDLRELARELELRDEVITRFAHYNVEQGCAQWVPSVKQNKRGWQCQRCGEQDLEEWPSFYGVAATCQSCQSIGVSNSLNVLYRDKRSILDGPSVVLFQPHWNLTEAQRLASDQVSEFIKGTSEKVALLWAACGAGKTEVCFPSAAWALAQGRSVLFAAPRQDVIHDIAPRLQRDFLNYPIQVLTGTTTVKFQVGGLVLATTHQVLRFWQCFDVIFMDEMDAFPYHGNKALEWGLNQALRPGGKLLYLTATPSHEGLKAVRKGQISLIRLPARHHRNPLPVPIWIRVGNSLEANRSIGLWAKDIESLRGQGSVLVFVPKISWIDPWIKSFKQRFSGWCVDGSYSSDPGRNMKIKNLQQGKYDIFISTTILERGITLLGIQVVVLGADHPIFDERALVQMAGRVGRTRERPGGGVLFLAKQITPAMKTAVQWIEEQNKRALELGLINPLEKEG
ncbi:helicase-related protein [Desulfosporosinus nitroreducens]|uniref:DEAD/DEAH box helicase family protein n=1 Tax=Desulfosporosinus nitroreducens TaxID=2018668 RepID=A0ABT8QL17_9FIRM|nr:helicase-related protein [Desulfosporosinus nitroreducens]MDO0822037.1 DEAD/DEAH box helicase family protein [Desulfosporosinus nitroreducens]